MKDAHINQIPEVAKDYIKFENRVSIWSKELIERLIELANNNVDFSPNWYFSRRVKFWVHTLFQLWS